MEVISHTYYLPMTNKGPQVIGPDQDKAWFLVANYLKHLDSNPSLCSGKYDGCSLITYQDGKQELVTIVGCHGASKGDNKTLLKFEYLNGKEF